MHRALLLIFLLLAACGRPLTGTETALITDIFGASVDTGKVRIVADAPLQSFTVNLPPRPRVTCQERVVPARTGTLRVTPAGLVAFNRMFLSEDWSLEDFAPRYPDAVSLYDTMLFAHEMTHIWQWQNRDRTGYHPLLAASEHLRSEDPYLFDPETEQPFLSYGYEQQAGLVEEYVCCALLDPAGARTARLRALISKEIPLGTIPPAQTFIAWPDAPRSGLCS
ncbi:MAG: hypothetical protein AAGA47_12855 [Pseudomonadota bacterium]